VSSKRNTSEVEARASDQTLHVSLSPELRAGLVARQREFAEKGAHVALSAIAKGILERDLLGSLNIKKRAR
jgi:hypothetical protein